MKCRRATAVALAVLSTVLSSASIAIADDHETAAPIPIMYPPDGDATMPVAVYFADNMVYTPQWRTGSLVRIETMILNVSTCYVGDDLDMLLMPLDVNSSVSNLYETVVIDGIEITRLVSYSQTELMANPELLRDTYMVSVSEIVITITNTDPNCPFEREFSFADGSDDNTVTREINKAGRLIYGFLWDTEECIAPAGVYEVAVNLPECYDIVAAVAHVYLDSDDTTKGEPTRAPPEVEATPLGFDVLPEGVATSGCGGVYETANQAYVCMGALIDGSGSGTSGDNGDENGGGNDLTGGGGNQNGVLGYNLRR
jgi:hypothetical protein